MKAIAIIPARLASTRLPRKVLADIHGKPLLWHVWSRVKKAKQFNEVYVATDAAEVQAVVKIWGGQVLMTSPDCTSGTDRIASCVNRLDADFIVNVQGDEPLIDPVMLDQMVERWQHTQAALITPVFPIPTIEELQNPNIVKVVRNTQGEAMYFSRHPIPYVREVAMTDWLAQHQFWGHIGVYGYRRDVLEAYPTLAVSQLELAERLEQLRFLDAGYRFQTIETDYRPIAVDVADDLKIVRKLLAERL